jgi:hypothetical protein
MVFLSVPHTNIAEEQCIPLRKITYDVFGQTDRHRWEYVNTAENYKNLANICSKFSNNKETELFSLSLLRGFPI